MVRDAFHRKVLIPFVFRIQQSRRGNYYNELLKTQWYSKREINRLAIKRLNNLIEYACNNVPYYSALFKKNNIAKQIEDLSDISTIPLLVRKEIQTNSKSLSTTRPNDFKIRESSTGGSTGNPIRFYTTRYSHDYSSADILRHYQWTGLNLGQKHAFLWGAERDSPMISFRGKLHGNALRYIWLNSFKLSKAKMRDYSKQLIEYKPKILIGYASSLHSFAKFLESENLDSPQLVGIQSSAEKLFTWQREKIENQFDCPVFDRYGCREVGNIGHECEQHNGLHISQELMHVEVLKDNEPAAFGEEGNIVLTSFMNYAFPFIRYKTGDRGVLLDPDDSCACGRSSAKLSTIIGRTSDEFYFENGVSVHGEYFTHLFYSIPNVKQFQVVQKSKSRIIIRIVLGDEDTEIPQIEISREIQQWVGVPIDIEFEFIEIINPTDTGKLRFTISEIDDSSS